MLRPGLLCCLRFLCMLCCLQGEDGDVRWVLFMLGFYLLAFMSFAGFILSGMWLAHIIVYMLPPYPLHPLLNTLFLAASATRPPTALQRLLRPRLRALALRLEAGVDPGAG